MKFLFKYATRNRPAWFKQTLEIYLSMLSGNHTYQFVITLDEDDVTMNNSKMKSFMDSKPGLVYHYGKHNDKIDAINANMKGLDFDILFLISDDMIPVSSGFDLIIVEDMMKYFPNIDGALHYPDDCCNKTKENAITLTIMGKKLYDRFGYIYHSDYKSFFCDNEFRDEVYRMGKGVFIPKVIVKHVWSGGPNSKDALYRRNSKLGRGDGAIYKRRKKAGFPK